MRAAAAAAPRHRVPERRFRVRRPAEQVHPARRVVLASKPGEMIAIVGLERRGQDDAREPAAAVLRRDGRRDPHRRRRTSATSRLKSLRAQIGIVTQETVLFDETIASNIAYGAPAASTEDIEAAARAAHAHEFIAALPNRVRHPDRRARPEAVGRAAAAAGDRARAAQELADPDPRRSDVVARRRVGAARPGRAAEPDAQPDVVRHRAPAVDRPARRRDHRAREGADRGGRASRRAAGASRAASTPSCTRCRSSRAGRPGQVPSASDDLNDQEHDRLRVADARR